MKPVQNDGRRLAVTAISKCGNLTSLVQTVVWMRWAAVPISTISSLCAFVVGGMLCSTLAGSVCTLCYAVDQLSASHNIMLTASVRETRNSKDKVILDQQNTQKKHDAEHNLGLNLLFNWKLRKHPKDVMRNWNSTSGKAYIWVCIWPIRNRESNPQ